MKGLILYLWQLPQNVIGLLVLLVYWMLDKIDWTYKDSDGVKFVYCNEFHGGISLGKYVILDTVYQVYNGRTEQHEAGHSKQSRILGPFYLLVIGLPSIIHAALYKDSPFTSYYDFYTEKWADKLGNVKR